jgi:hypothetical protein
MSNAQKRFDRMTEARDFVRRILLDTSELTSTKNASLAALNELYDYAVEWAIHGESLLADAKALHEVARAVSTEAPREAAAIRPAYYGGAENPFEVIKVFRGWFGESDYRIWLRMTAIKYLARAGKKDGEPELRDLEKAHFYLGEMIASLKRVDEGSEK